MTAVTYFVYDRDNIHKKKLASAEKALDWNGTPYVKRRKKQAATWPINQRNRPNKPARLFGSCGS
jgi:hypothetical protein